MTLGLLLALGACDGGTEDLDGDGVAAPLDCDDDNPDVKPGAVETCDGLDNDCSGAADDGLGDTLYADNDGDGFGDPAASEVFCDEPAGYVTEAGDCDDTDAEVNPGAAEDCTEVDRNCDGQPTTGAPPMTWYFDGDGDGYGRSDASIEQCEVPPQHASQDGDCDDGDATVFPSADEVCDGLDNDCDTYVDDSATDAVTVYADTDGDGYGADGSGTQGCPAEGATVDAGDCDDAEPAVHPGALDICDGLDNDCDPSTDEDVIDGDAYYADTDNDGYGDDGTTVYGCEQPAYSAIDPGDCDDTDPATSPGGTEVCGGGDEDCDGTVDNNASDADLWYPDADGDGYGDTALSTLSCTPVPNTILDGTDCDDNDPGINPDTVWYVDADLDLHGDPLNTVASCLQPADAVAAGDDCDDTDPTSFPGNIEVCDGYIDNDCDPSTNEDTTVVWYSDADGDGFGDAAVTVDGCTPPPSYVATGDDCDDTDPTLNPTQTPGCIQDHCGTVSLSETWKSTVEHLVSCDVVVEGAAKPVVTIQDGVVVRFDPGTELRVARTAEASLQVQGTSLGVTFTSSQASPVPGDWDGLTIGANDQGSDLVGLTVEYAGSNGKGGIVVEGGDPVLDFVVARSNLGDGLHVTGGEPLVVDSMLVDNTDNGLYVGRSGGLSRLDRLGTLGPSFQGNVLTGNGGRPVSVPGSHADEIDLTNVVSPNATDEIELLDGTLRLTGTWVDHGIPYVVAANAVLSVEDGPQALLYVEDGVEIYFDAGSELTIGDGAEGVLEILDGPNGVLFSATPAVIVLSDSWEGVKFGADDGGSVIRNLTIEYGGGNGRGNLWVAGSAPTFRNVLSQWSDSSGMYVSGAAAAPDIADSLFLDNDEHGVYVEPSSGIARSLLGPTFANNIVTGNGQSPVVMPSGSLGQLDPSTTFVGNGDRIGVHGGDLLEDTLWRRLDEDYEVFGTIDIGGPQDPVLEVEDGVTIYWARDSRLKVGTTDDGSLVVDGAVTGVRFTSADPAPGEGDWHGIEIGRNGTTSPQTTILGLTVEYAGGNDTPVLGGGAIELVDRDGCGTKEPPVDLDDITIVSSSKSGLWFESYTTFSADGMVVSGALEGCVDYVETTCAVPDVVSFTNVDCQTGVVFGTWPLAQVDELAGGNTFPGPVVIETSNLDSSVSIPALPVPYLFTGLVSVGDLSSPALTVEAGAELQFEPGAGLEVGTQNNNPASFVVAPGAVFTSSQALPAPGDWKGVTVGSETVLLDIQGATISYGGGNFTGALWLDGPASGLVDATTITDSISCGVYNDPSSGAVVTNMAYAGNLGGDYCP